MADKTPPLSPPAVEPEAEEQEAEETKRGQDPELLLMGRLNRELAKLDDDARLRVMRYLNSRHGAPETKLYSTKEIDEAIRRSMFGKGV